MNHVFGKLQFKDQARIHVLGPPAEFKATLDEMRDKTEVATRADSRQRQVAIDEDWSALRFRHVDFIKALKRDPKHAMSAKGKRRARRKA